jgi:hypothetical protein
MSETILRKWCDKYGMKTKIVDGKRKARQLTKKEVDTLTQISILIKSKEYTHKYIQRVLNLKQKLSC